MLLSDAIDLFLRRCAIMGLSDVTVVNYVDRLGRFLDYVSDIDINDLTRDDIESYGLYLLTKNKENNFVECTSRITKYSVRSYLIDVRTFLNYLFKENLCSNLAQYVVIPKTGKKQVVIYTDEQIQTIFDCFKNCNSLMEYRNYCIVALMYDSGLRRQEVCNLMISDVNFSEGILTVNGKGDKMRFVPAGNLSLSLIKKYLSLRTDFTLPNLFISNTFQPLTGNAIENVFYRIRQKVSFPVSAHKLRHNFATNFLLDQYEKYGKADIYQLQVILGHSDTKTTMQYLHIANQIIACRTKNSRLDSRHFEFGL